MEFVGIQAGSFIMGCSVGDAECTAQEKPAHRVAITRSFEIGKYQVTQAQYEGVKSVNPSHFRGPNNPVETVSWDDAQSFANHLIGSGTVTYTACPQRQNGNMLHAPETNPAVMAR